MFVEFVSLNTITNLMNDEPRMYFRHIIYILMLINFILFYWYLHEDNNLSCNIYFLLQSVLMSLYTLAEPTRCHLFFEAM